MSNNYRELTKSEELADLDYAVKELIQSFEDPEKGDDNIRDFLIGAEILHPDGTVVPYFKTVVNPDYARRFLKK